MSQQQWFVECNPVSNENIARELAALGVGYENAYHGLKDKDDKTHDVWLIPSEYVTRLRTAKRSDMSRIKHFFRFFIRDTPNGLLRQADFLEKKRLPAKVQRAKEDLEKLKARKLSAEKK